MYGDKPIISVRKRLKQSFCWHRPVKSNYYDYECPKCGFITDKPMDNADLPAITRQLFWLFTGRLPKEDKCAKI